MTSSAGSREKRRRIVSEVLYLGSVLFAIGAYAFAGWLLWQGVEVGYWIYCKVTGKDY